MAKAAKPKTPAQPEAKAAAPAKGAQAAQLADDPALDALTQGLAALQAKDWAKAVTLFEAAVHEADRPEVKDRARQYLTASRQKAGAGEEARPAKGAGEVDPFLQAVYEKNRGNLAEVLAISHKGGRDQKDERFAYLTATVHAIEGRWDEATQALTRAIELNPKNRVHAFHDPDFAELRKNRDLRPLFGLA
jgi:tetratricopeptide (TPR) repeat protein